MYVLDYNNKRPTVIPTRKDNTLLANIEYLVVYEPFGLTLCKSEICAVVSSNSFSNCDFVVMWRSKKRKTAR